MYVKGYFQSGNDNNINLDKLHGWTLAKIDGKWVPLDATNNFFNGRLPSGFIFRYYGDYYRNTDVDWGLFGDKSSNIKNETNFQSNSNPTLDLKIKALSFFSRELEDDDEGDFKLNFYDNDDEEEEGDFEKYLEDDSMYIIIALIVAFILVISIFSINHLIKRKRKNKNLDDLSISLSLNG
jgi:hypothetical protein